MKNVKTTKHEKCKKHEKCYLVWLLALLSITVYCYIRFFFANFTTRFSLEKSFCCIKEIDTKPIYYLISILVLSNICCLCFTSNDRASLRPPPPPHTHEWFKFELSYLYLFVDLFMDKLATKTFHTLIQISWLIISTTMYVCMYFIEIS